MYIADTYNNRIRKIVISTGIISSVAGSGIYGYSGDEDEATSAGLSQPYGVAVDASGSLMPIKFSYIFCHIFFCRQCLRC